MSDRIPPQDLAAEEGLLGSLLVSPSAFEASENLTPSDFYRTAHGEIFAAATAIFARSEPADPVTVVAELKARGKLESVGGHLRIHELVESVSTPASAPHYARIIAELSSRRRIIKAASEILERGYGNSPDLSEQAERLIFAAVAHRAGSEVSGMEAIISEVIDNLEASERGVLATGIPTGLASLDAITGGLQRGALIVVAARPGVGKSALCGNIVTSAAQAKHRSLFCSVEMSRWEVGARMLASDGRINWHHLRKGSPRTEDWAALSGASERLVTLPISVADAGASTVLEIRSLARHTKPDLIVVDYLQLLGTHARTESRNLELGEMTRSLKLLAKETDSAVVVCSQLNRDLEKSNREPRLSDLRDSGAIESDADVVAFLHCDSKESGMDPRQVKLIIAKHRNGPVGSFLLTFHASQTRFADEPRVNA